MRRVYQKLFIYIILIIKDFNSYVNKINNKENNKSNNNRNIL